MTKLEKFNEALKSTLLEKFSLERYESDFPTHVDVWKLCSEEQGGLSEENLLTCLAEESALEFLSKEQVEDLDDYFEISIPFLTENLILPFSWSDDSITFAVCSPETVWRQEMNLSSLFDKKIDFKLSSRRLIERKISELYEHRKENDLDAFDASEDSLRDLATEAPIIRLVNDIFNRALELEASDIHVEPDEDELHIRFRIDGVLKTYFSPPLKQYPAIASRLKLIGGLNIAESRVPQDGRIDLTINNVRLDLRMNTLPAMHGESVVMRLLRKKEELFTLENIGMLEELRSRFMKMIQKPFGVILVVGPTGSGKTTTLYSVLKLLNSGKEKIITVEDPVEYQMKGITQVHVKSSVGLSFAQGLRSIVRQDPDIILVGEIRDKETAEITVQSALTGHLVLSTLHTNDAAGAISRLQDMGVDNFLLASSIIGVLSQRLVRKYCGTCGGYFDAENPMSSHSPSEEQTAKVKSCRKCQGSGYSGRLGIFEFLEMSDEIREAIMSSKDSSQIAKVAQSQGMLPIAENGKKKVLKGLTSLAEVARVCQSH